MSVMQDKSLPPTPVPGHLANYPTPLHVYYEKYLLADAGELETGLKSTLPGCELYYSTKTNSLPPLLKALAQRGWGLEAVGPKDRAAAVECGVNGEKILLNGAAWNRAALEEAIFKHGVRNITVDSESMAELLGSVLKARADIPKMNVALRLSDGDSHFGFHPSRENFARAWNLLPKEAIASLGFQIHRNPSGSVNQLSDLTADFRFRAQRVNFSLACLEGTPWQAQIKFADLGGGFDSPFVYRVPPSELGEFHSPPGAAAFRARYASPRFSLRESAAETGAAVKEELGHFWRGKRILFEPGRAVCTRSLSTLIEVKSVKRGFYPDAEVILTDGNTAILGPLHRNVHSIVPARQNGSGASTTFVYGNLPHSGDWLFQNVMLPPQREGDRLLVEHTGAYFLPLEASFGHQGPMIVRADRDEVVKA